jgi:hypothetical protein
MAYVTIYYHREPSRLGKHARYIAERPGSAGLHGLGPAFRALRGDVGASVRLLEQHAARARTQTGDGTREGPFVRLLFTLPTDLAQRVDRTARALKDGPRLVLRDALEATFRSAGRELQGVYAVHFHAQKREAHGHVHVDLSPVDLHGRTTFLTPQQRARLRAAWEREVRQALGRVERRSARPVAARDTSQTPHREDAPGRRETTARRTGRGDDARPDGFDDRRVTRRPLRLPARVYMPAVAARLFGWPRSPFLDLFLRALLARSTRRRERRRPLLAVRFAFGLPVPRVTVRADTPLVPRQLLRVPFAS